jgi:hypothetical protein
MAVAFLSDVDPVRFCGANESMTKARKTSGELRTMIMERVKDSPKFPRGMDLAVRQRGVSWAVDCIPPTTKKLAYADCCELITRIAAEIRLECDLADPD